MKILVLANNDVGLYKFRKELIHSLLKENKVTIALPYGLYVDSFIESGCGYFETEMERRGRNPLKDFRLFLIYLRLIKEENPDLIITYTIKPNIYGGLAARFLKRPYSANITGLGTAFEKQGLLQLFVTTLYRIALKNAKTVFFENCSNKELFIGKRIIRETQACLLNGAGVSLTDYPLQGYPKNNRFRFLFIGRIMQEKGVEELFAAMKKLNKTGTACTLDVVGTFDEDYESIIDKYQKEGWLVYHGFQSDVKPFIRDCDCFVLPSWHEGMANTNLECAASGRPIITSNIPGCREAVVDGVSGYLCEKKSVESLFQTMKKVCETACEQRRVMGLAGREHMEQSFNREEIVEETIRKIF